MTLTTLFNNFKVPEHEKKYFDLAQVCKKVSTVLRNWMQENSKNDVVEGQ